MPITVDTANATSATDLATNGYVEIPYPAGIIAGDTLLVFAGNDSQTSTPQFDDVTYKPAGFERVASGGDAVSDTAVAAFSRIADGTEAGTVRLTPQSGVDLWAVMVRVSGTDATAPIDVVGTVALTGSSASHTAPAASTSVADGIAFYVLSFDGGDGVPFGTPAGWTKGGEIQAGAGAANVAGTWGFKLQGAPGSTSDAVITSNVADGSATFQFTLKPAPGGTPPEQIGIGVVVTVEAEPRTLTVDPDPRVLTVDAEPRTEEA